MRLGGFECQLLQGSIVQKVYEKDLIIERHRHRYELNSNYVETLENAGLRCSGRNPQSGLVEIIEIPHLKWFIGTQFHPEYSSTVLHPHPLFLSFLKCCID
ncbi:MAG: CTP synthase, partial [Bacteroidaceae bacterium]|nr:CTP synthase [Bacteroidaceae bacterium]